LWQETKISRGKDEDSLEGERKDKGTTFTKAQLQVGFGSRFISAVNNSFTFFPQILEIEELQWRKPIHIFNSDNNIRAPGQLPLHFHTCIMVSACYFASAQGFWTVSHHISETSLKILARKA